jgi:hypothetical protein
MFTMTPSKNTKGRFLEPKRPSYTWIRAPLGFLEHHRSSRTGGVIVNYTTLEIREVRGTLIVG